MSKIDEELEQIRKATGADEVEMVQAEDVVAFAKAHPDSALHKRFNWDDGAAAHQWRLNQARQIIRAWVKILPGCNKPVRAVVSLTTDRHKPGGGYRSTASVLAVQKDREQLLADALAELETFRARYAMFQELAGVFAAIDAVKTKATKAPAVGKRRKLA